MLHGGDGPILSPLLARLGARLSLLALAAAAAAVLAACGAARAPSATGAAAAPGTRTTGPAQLRSPPPSTAPPATVSGATGPSSSSSDPTTSLADCSSSGLRAVVDLQPPSAVQPANRVRGLLAVTDVGAACLLDGFPRLAPASGRAPLVTVDQPASPSPVDLASGQTAYAGVEWTSGASCPEPLLRLAYPGGSGSVQVVVDGASDPTATHLCAGPVSVSPFEASAQGSVAFADSVRPGLPACAARDLRASLSGAEPAGATAEITLTNLSSAPCLLDGPVDLEATAGAVDIHAQAMVSATSGTGASSPLPLAIEPAQSMTAAVTLPFPAGRGACPSSAVSGTVLMLPSGAGSLRVDGRAPRACAAGTSVPLDLQVASG